MGDTTQTTQPTQTPAPATPSVWGTPADDVSGLESLMRWELPPVVATQTPETAATPTPDPQPTPQPAYQPPVQPPQPPPDNTLRDFITTGGLANQMAQGFAAALDNVRRTQPTPPPPEPIPPTLPSADSLDPDLLATVAGTRDYAAAIARHTANQVRSELRAEIGQALSQIAPVVRGAAAVNQLAPAVIQIQMANARDQAREIAVSRGMPVEQFDAVLPYVIDGISKSHVPDDQKMGMQMDPKQLFAGTMLYLLEAGQMPNLTGTPLPVQSADRTQPLPSSPVTPTPSQGVPPVKDDTVRLTEHILSRIDPEFKFTDDMVEERNRMVAAGIRRIEAA